LKSGLNPSSPSAPSAWPAQAHAQQASVRQQPARREVRAQREFVSKTTDFVSKRMMQTFPGIKD
jgi:hypothetical protein